MNSFKALLVPLLSLATLVAGLSGPLALEAAPVNALELRPVQKLFDLVINPVVRLLFAAAVFYFVYGIWSYVRKSDDPSERAQGGKHILYSTIGLFIMISVWGIIAVIQRTVGQ
ncbi:MAG: hypothetical protein HZA81_01480 [Candidatus Taylorbacteria bacterium]|nr:hypothetical protein [Candidatus Taylorbacteria bacterium]